MYAIPLHVIKGNIQTRLNILDDLDNIVLSFGTSRFMTYAEQINTIRLYKQVSNIYVVQKHLEGISKYFCQHIFVQFYFINIYFNENTDTTAHLPVPAEFLKQHNLSAIFGSLHYLIICRNIKMKTRLVTSNSIEPGQTVRVCMVVWLCSGGKDLSLSIPAGLLVIQITIVIATCMLYVIIY